LRRHTPATKAWGDVDGRKLDPSLSLWRLNQNPCDSAADGSKRAACIPVSNIIEPPLEPGTSPWVEGGDEGKQFPDSAAVALLKRPKSMHNGGRHAVCAFRGRLQRTTHTNHPK